MTHAALPCRPTRAQVSVWVDTFEAPAIELEELPREGRSRGSTYPSSVASTARRVSRRVRLEGGEQETRNPYISAGGQAMMATRRNKVPAALDLICGVGAMSRSLDSFL